ncbi:G-box-binding factor-like [Ptychodera flava]|uniref:G-box-binding factor-like n=1 Tax=Ptychodera flava TaxID=63121 RepID=UPI003969E9AB
MSIFQESHNVPIQGLGVATQREVPSEDATTSSNLHASSPDFVDEHQETCPHRLAQRCVCSSQSSQQYPQPPKNQHHQPPQCAICLQQQQQHIVPRQQQLLHLQQGMTSQQPKTFQQQHHQGLQQRPMQIHQTQPLLHQTQQGLHRMQAKQRGLSEEDQLQQARPQQLQQLQAQQLAYPKPPAKMQSRSTTSQQSRQHDNIVVEGAMVPAVIDMASPSPPPCSHVNDDMSTPLVESEG